VKRLYELVYVVSPDATEEQIQTLHTQIEEIVGRLGATIENTENWGRRRLAYEIGLHKEGTYVLELISGGGDVMKELDRRLRVMRDLVIRHLVVRVDEENQVVEQARSRRKSESTRRRLARGLPAERQPGEGPRPEDFEDGRDSAEVQS